MEEGIREFKQMKNGFSSSIVTIDEELVLKESGNWGGLQLEAEFCERFYPLTPKVLWHGNGFYIMERVEEPPCKLSTKQVIETLRTAETILSEKVWVLESPYKIYDWPTRLMLFLDKTLGGQDWQFWERLIDKYVDKKAQSSLIHGDPTLSNIMYRKGQMVLIDPIPSSERLPQHWHVDAGKFLQSAIGWERLRFDWPYDPKECVAYSTTSTYSRPWFWCGVHCTRIIPYAKNHPKERAWAINMATSIFNYLGSIEENNFSLGGITNALRL